MMDETKRPRLLFILGAIILSTGVLLIASVAMPQGSSKPTLSEERVFRFYAKEGTFEVISLAEDSYGKVIEKKSEDEGFRNGEVVAIRLSNTKGILLGNNGSTDLQIVEEKGSTLFIETTPLGGKHILIIYDQWDDEQQGFKSTYVRNIEDRILLFKILRSTYKGIAKPDRAS